MKKVNEQKWLKVSFELMKVFVSITLRN